MELIGIFLGAAPFLLIGVGYYYDFKQNPTQFISDIKGGTLYVLGIFIIILIERIIFDIGIVYAVLQIAVLIMLSFWIKFSAQKEK